MINKISSLPNRAAQKLLMVAVGVGCIVLAFVGLFFVTNEPSPYTAELAYIEYSGETDVIGSVVPASCESNPINSHYISGVMCQCALSASPTCTGGGCAKTISWNTNYNPLQYGQPNLRVNGAIIGQIGVTGSMQREIPAGGQTFSLHRPDGVQLCAAYVPGPPPPSVQFVGTPTTVGFGNSTTLTWTVANVSSCTASGAWSGGKPAAGTNSEVVTPTGPATYTLSCSGPGGTITRNVPIGVSAPTLTLTANPSLIEPDGSATLTWSVSGATSCSAFGGWSGPRTATNGSHSESVSPTAVTTYILGCSGPGGTVYRTAVVRVPSGSITTSSCVIPDDGASCPVTVNWSSENFFGGTQVAQDITFSTQTSGVNVSRAVDPDNDTFTLRDAASSFERTASAFARCTAQSTWTGSRCLRTPVITVGPGPVQPPTGGTDGANIVISADSIVRRGEPADVAVEINATYSLRCTLSGAIDETITYTAGSGTQTFSFQTRPLQAATVVSINCASIADPMVTTDAEVLIQVTAAQFES